MNKPTHQPGVETTDPLVGTQEETDSAIESSRAPHEEVELHRSPTGHAVKSRLAAAVLGILFGALGAHRFYLGYHKVGGFQLGLTLLMILTVVITALAVGGSSASGMAWTAFGVIGITMIWGLFEGIFILAGMLEHDAAGRPLR